MGREKFEVWLHPDDAQVVRMQMQRARIRSKAAYARASLLSGNVAARQAYERLLGELVARVNDLDISLQAATPELRDEFSRQMRELRRDLKRLLQGLFREGPQ